MCLPVLKDLANGWTDLVLLYNVAASVKYEKNFKLLTINSLTFENVRKRDPSEVWINHTSLT